MTIDRQFFLRFIDEVAFQILFVETKKSSQSLRLMIFALVVVDYDISYRNTDIGFGIIKSGVDVSQYRQVN